MNTYWRDDEPPVALREDPVEDDEPVPLLVDESSDDAEPDRDEAADGTREVGPGRLGFDEVDEPAESEALVLLEMVDRRDESGGVSEALDQSRTAHDGSTEPREAAPTEAAARTAAVPPSHAHAADSAPGGSPEVAPQSPRKRWLAVAGLAAMAIAAGVFAIARPSPETSLDGPDGGSQRARRAAIEARHHGAGARISGAPAPARPRRQEERPAEDGPSAEDHPEPPPQPPAAPTSPDTAAVAPPPATAPPPAPAPTLEPEPAVAKGPATCEFNFEC